MTHGPRDQSTDESKRKQATLDRLNKLLAEVTPFRRSLTPETDRGCALMAAAYLDFSLRKLLESVLIDDSAVIEDIFRHGGALDSFSSRIEFAYGLGLIDSEVRRDLNLIRKIRNEFGHVHEPISFDEKSIASRCSELSNHPLDKAAASRDKFISTAMGLLGSIHVSSWKAVKPSSPAPRSKQQQADFVAGYKQFKESTQTLTTEQMKRMLDSPDFGQIIGLTEHPQKRGEILQRIKDADLGKKE